VNDKPDMYRAARVERTNERARRIRDLLLSASAQNTNLTTEQLSDLPNHPRAAFRALKAAYMQQFYDNLKRAHDDRLEQEKNASSEKPYGERKSPAEAEQAKRAAAARVLYDNVEAARRVVGTRIFDSFLEYEIAQFDALVDNTLTFVRVVPVHSVRTTDLDGEGQALSGGLLTKNPDRLWRSDT